MHMYIPIFLIRASKSRKAEINAQNYLLGFISGRNSIRGKASNSNIIIQSIL